MLLPTHIDADDWIQQSDVLAEHPAPPSMQPSTVSALLKRVSAAVSASSSSARPGDAVINVSHYAENAAGSGIFPVRRATNTLSDAKQEGERDGKDDDFDDSASRPLLVGRGQHDPAAVDLQQSSSTSSSADIRVSSIFLLVQGLFAGFAFVTLFASTDSSGATGVDSGSFLLSYADRAGQMRRFMFLLSSLSLIGSLDSLLTALTTPGSGRGEKSNRSEQLHRLSRISICTLSSFLYLLAFLSTTIMSKVDTLLTMHYGLASTDQQAWWELVLQANNFPYAHIHKHIHIHMQYLEFIANVVFQIANRNVAGS